MSLWQERQSGRPCA